MPFILSGPNPNPLYGQKSGEFSITFAAFLYGFFGGGYTGNLSNVIDYITLATTTQNAADTGDLTVARYGAGGV